MEIFSSFDAPQSPISFFFDATVPAFFSFSTLTRADKDFFPLLVRSLLITVPDYARE